MKYLLEHDTVHGRFNGSVEVGEDEKHTGGAADEEEKGEQHVVK